MNCDYKEDKINRLKARYPDLTQEIVTENTDCPILFVTKDNLIKFLESIRAEEGFEYNYLADLTAYDDNPPIDDVPDYGLGVLRDEGKSPRFVVVYNLFSLQNKDRVRIKVRLKEDEEIPTIVPLWKGANWLEREVWDLYGIKFTDHPNLRRIMLDERWVGHPLRKDYPIKKYQRWEDSLEMESVGVGDQ